MAEGAPEVVGERESERVVEGERQRQRVSDFWVLDHTKPS